MARLTGLSWGLVVNDAIAQSSHAMGFDAFASHAPNQPVFVLCDGANGTPQGGGFARALSAAFLDYFAGALPKGDGQPNRPSVDLAAVGQYLDGLGTALDEAFAESAATLTATRFFENRLQMLHVGDSHVMAFQRRFFVGWRHVVSLGRHRNVLGQPTELIGAPNPVHPYWYETTTPGDWVVALMTDGAGDFLSPDDVIAELQPIGRMQPSDEDLSFCARSLASLALSRESDDDISVCLVWMRLG